MVEYYVLSTGNAAFFGAEAMQDELNSLAEEDWYVVCYCPVGIILEREKPSKGEGLAEEIIRRQCTFSWDLKSLEVENETV
jgi:hypothetical protein